MNEGEKPRRKDAGMPSAEQKQFVYFIEEGQALYGLGRADLCDFAEAKLTPEIQFSERMGIGGRQPNPIDIYIKRTGTTTLKKRSQRRRWVENALSRPCRPEKARVIVEMLLYCKGRHRWLSHNSLEHDSWYLKFHRLRAEGVSFIEPIEGRYQAPVACYLIPDDTRRFAANVASALTSAMPSLRKKNDELIDIIAAHMRSEGFVMADALADFVERWERRLCVRFASTEKRSVPEDVMYHEPRITILRERHLRGNNQFHPQAEDADGKVPTPSQFLRGVYKHFALPAADRVSNRVKEVLPENGL